MTEDQHKMLAAFEARVRQLIFLCDELKGENRELKEKLDVLSEAYQAQMEENQVLKSKYDNLKIARAMSANPEAFAGAKKRISGLVREVDKCIALLNE